MRGHGGFSWDALQYNAGLVPSRTTRLRLSAARLRTAGRRLATLAVVLTLGVGGALAVATPAAAFDEGTIHSLVNQSRAGSGLRPLTLNGSLNQVALSWANQMAASGVLAHNPSYASQIPGGWTAAGENVAQGYPTGAEVHAGWMASAGHRANVLGNFTDIGIAHIAAGGTWWSVQVFASYAAPAPAPVAVAAPAAAPAPAPAPVPAPAAAPAPAPAAAAPAGSAEDGHAADSGTGSATNDSAGDDDEANDAAAQRSDRDGEGGAKVTATVAATDSSAGRGARQQASGAADAAGMPVEAPLGMALLVALVLAGAVWWSGARGPRSVPRNGETPNSNEKVTDAAIVA